jgi:transcriptional regulator with XRE-family HTH domain
MEISVEKLKELREARALSLRELANEAGVGHNTIYRIE